MICKSYAAAFDSSPQRQRLRRYQHHHNAFDVICSLSTTCVEAVGGVRPNALSTLKETKGLSQVAHQVWLIYVANVFMLLTSSVLSLIWWCYRQGRLCCSSAGTCICLCTHSLSPSVPRSNRPLCSDPASSRHGEAAVGHREASGVPS